MRRGTMRGALICGKAVHRFEQSGLFVLGFEVKFAGSG